MIVPVQNTFASCPQCGCEATEVGSNPFICGACSYTFYFGPAVAVGAIVPDAQGRVLMFRRVRDPGKGLYGLPGGFVDAGETAEQAVVREVLEEVGLKIVTTEYLGSFVNRYEFRGMAIPVLDLFYACEVESFDGLTPAPEEVRSIEFVRPTPKQLDQMAFLSNRQALELFLATKPCATDADR